VTRLDDVQAAHDEMQASRYPDGDYARSLLFREHAAVPGLLAIARAAEASVEAVESRSGEQDGGIALQVTYRTLVAALADFEAGRDG